MGQQFGLEYGGSTPSVNSSEHVLIRTVCTCEGQASPVLLKQAEQMTQAHLIMSIIPILSTNYVISVMEYQYSTLFQTLVSNLRYSGQDRTILCVIIMVVGFVCEESCLNYCLL